MGRRETEPFRRLRVRLTLLCTFATGVILLAAAIAAQLVSEGRLTDRGESAFRSEVNAVFYHLRSQTVVDRTWVAQTEASGALVLWLELSGAPTLHSTEKPESVRALAAAARETALRQHAVDLDAPPADRYVDERADFTLRDAGHLRWRATVGRIPQEGGWLGVTVLQSLAEEEREIWEQRLSFAAFTVAALVLLALFAWVFTRRLLSPLEESRQLQTAFIAAASHELRSPLAVVRASLSALRSAPPEEVDHFADLADGECVRMSRLVGDMLALAGADSGSWSMRPGEIEADTLLLEVYERYRPLALGREMTLTAGLPEEALPRCCWDGQRVEQLLCVLLDNALAYTPPGGRVHLSAQPAGDGVSFTVADSGPGVPDEEKERIFSRFFRGDRARTDREHYGLGLSIAWEIVRLHGGTLTVADGTPCGAVFTALLPRAALTEKGGR